MIRTDAEYRNAQERLKRDAETIEMQRKKLKAMDLSNEQVRRALEPMRSFRDQLLEEVETYERMRRGDLEVLHTLTSIGRWLIGARIAKGWTLKELAEKLDVSVQQVSRDENNDYRGISAERAQRILEVLGVRFRAEVEEPIVGGEEGQLTPALPHAST